ncbi:MAG: GTPase ObgE [Dehalococcoidales bacterium]|nr:GTPase ObgE [Dehalococcoidales bacterium]
MITVKAGNGGEGTVAFRREKYVPYGGPNGGDGGRGGDVVFKADESIDSLRGYRGRKKYRAGDGGDGQGSRKHGQRGEDLVLPVPVGTIIKAVGEDREERVIDLNTPGEMATVARGGRGGWGNTHYTTSTNQAPRIAQRGEQGEEFKVSLEMRLIADVGIIGYPNAGKSTLLGAASSARPKVAPYPFTTLEPILGVVEVGYDRFVMAEIPGLIEGAHEGRGLGHDFLRHAMRTKVLLHLIDGSAPSPVENMLAVNREMALFDTVLAGKIQIIALNKIDLIEVEDRLAEIKKQLSGAGVKAHYVSAVTGQGIKVLMEEVFKLLQGEKAAEKESATPEKIFRPRPRDSGLSVRREGDEFVISAQGLERIKGGFGVTPDELRWQLNLLLEKMGANKMLLKAGIKSGDKVRCGELTWEWFTTRG